MSISQRIDRWMINEGANRFFVAFFILVHILVFGFSTAKFLLKDDQKAARTSMGLTYPIARASANVLLFDVACILLPMCRNLVSLLRNTPVGSILPLDKNVTFHKIVGWSIVLFSWIHTIAHWVNFARLSNAQGLGVKGWALLNFTTGPGVLGNLMLIVLMAMAYTALEKHRRANFERFWYTHHLFTVFFLLWSFHGSYCMITPDRAPFCKQSSSFWKFFLAGGTVYLAERILREYRATRGTFISKVIAHPSRVCEIQVKNAGCNAKAGQYIFLCCPEVSIHQYHPFTLTSSPEEDYLSVHIRCVGDFTSALARTLGCDFGESEGPNDKSKARQTRIVASNEDARRRILPKVVIDGPFGSASEDVFKFETVMLVGAGIGVTPFASILKSIWYRVNYPKEKTRLSKVYFYWVCRDFESFEWFQSLLLAIEEQDIGHLIEIHAYLTATIRPDDAENLYLQSTNGSEVDAITGLRSMVNYGRPPWDDIYKSLAKIHPATDVGVFFCGPKPLGHTLHLKCNEYSTTGPDGTRFIFCKENF
ncbi:ferric reductase NAD binding domain-domain-containing protein [Protomyces lactucae-debilis]|uniref:Ferric reductase NAD binding domain-domain-containing protein n=1 Tax=Protomyces lactucae-debilis TaxID=2754530 RepID=A0A1Y2FH75_PROLT|nr:ferric reductase NAD binding domain-containing protein [Protomyces lactucae-debilis]ORY83273.1 ferric reductase NAD binding domain-domain-containing protein [Protomyces lactucae-debilis]